MMLLVERLLAGAMVVPFALGLASAPADRKDVVLTFADSRIVESSGLVSSGDTFVTVNDSGDDGRIFVVDRAGDTVGTASWGEATDVEALAPWRRGSVLVGDIGDNPGERDSVSVLRVPVERGEREVTPEVFELTYPGGPRDAEALLVHPVTRRIYVASKELFGGTLYAAPREPSSSRANRLEAVGPVIGIVTDGAFFPDGRHLVLRDYGRAVVYAFPSLEQVGEAPLPDQPQGEGIAVGADGTVYVSTEGQFTPVLRVALPDELRDVVTPPPTPSATPTTESTTEPTTGPTTKSREGRELPETTDTDRPFWPWFLTGWLGLGVIVALLLVLRRGKTG
ncbi:MAG: hypothetical protein Q8O61_04245 [Nocardioides sp.]|nr:hypothetical protein [Nocardioides sp.]